MARHNSRRDGPRTPRPVPEGDSPQDADLASAVSVDEGVLRDVDTLPRPAGFGETVETASQDFQVSQEYVVPEDTIAYLREASFSVPSNAEVILSLAGLTLGPFSQEDDLTIPLDPGQLPPGSKVRILARSTDGSAVTARAVLVVLEV